MGWCRVAFVAVVLTVLTLVLAPLQLLAIRFGRPLARRLPWYWHRVACFVAGFRVHVVGRPSQSRPLLIAANHQSWSDILVLGRVMPLSFIAKAEVAGWPAFGILAKLQRTVFVARDARRRTGEQAGAVAERLAAGDAMVLFAEGTTSDGNGVLAFKTALFGAAQAALKQAGEAGAGSSVAVQPVALAYTHANGIALGRTGRPLVGWPGDVALGPHLLGVLKEGAIDVTVVFGEPIAFSVDSDRKAVARAAQTRVEAMLTDALAARPPRFS